MTPTLKLRPSVRLARRAERDLDAAAADVDDDGGRGADVDAISRGQVDQPGFLGTGDHLDADAGLPVDFGDEVGAVVGFARGARGAGHDLVDLVRFGEAPEFGERLERGADGRGGQAAAAQAAGAEADHVFFPVDDLKREVRAHLDHDHVDRVGADVDGSDAHAGTGLVPGVGLVPLHRRYILAEQARVSAHLLAVFLQKLTAILP